MRSHGVPNCAAIAAGLFERGTKQVAAAGAAAPATAH